jgi:hypothetical protein
MSAPHLTGLAPILLTLALAPGPLLDDDDRDAPTRPEPVVVDGVRYEPVDEDITATVLPYRRASVRAIDVETGRAIWTAPISELYEPTDPEEKADATLGRITDLRPLGDHGLFVQVRGRAGMLLDAQTGAFRVIPDHRGESRTCPLHDHPLAEDAVPIAYGLIRSDPDELRARQDLYPFANVSVAGGCVISPGSPKQALVRYCPDCREARTAWLEGRR